MSAFNDIASLWMEGTMRTLDAFRSGFGATMDDPLPVTRSRVIYESGLVRLRHYEVRARTKIVCRCFSSTRSSSAPSSSTSSPAAALSSISSSKASTFS